MVSTAEIIRQSGLVDKLFPEDQARLLEGLAQLIDRSGRLSPKTLRSIRTLEEMSWGPSDSTRRRSPYGGTMVLLAAHATTPPTTGAGAVIRVTAETESAGVVAITPDLVLPKTNRIAQIPMMYIFPSGTWFHASVIASNGASGVSISLAMRAE